MNHRDPLFITHVVVLTVGIVSFLVTLISSLLYFIEHRELKNKKFTKFFKRLPSLKKLDRVAMKMLILGFVFLTFGMLTGVYLAHESWKPGWQTNMKFILSLITWLWYTLLLLLRYKAGLRGGKFFIFSLVGFSLLFIIFAGLSFIPNASS